MVSVVMIATPGLRPSHRCWVRLKRFGCDSADRDLYYPHSSTHRM